MNFDKLTEAFNKAKQEMIKGFSGEINIRLVLKQGGLSKVEYTKKEEV